MDANSKNKKTQNNTQNKLKKIIFFIVFVSIVLIVNPYEFTSTTTPTTRHELSQMEQIKRSYRPPIKIKNDFPKGKPVTVDVVIPFIASNLYKVIAQLESWNENEALPCDEYTAPHYYADAQSNLVFYLNFGSEPKIEETVNAKVESSIWRKCFNQIKFIYANNTVEEDAYPKGISVQFYKYYIIGPPSDYFFWMETDVNVIKKNWQIELCRLVIDTNEARGNKAFFMMGSNYISAIEHTDIPVYSFATHLNGNALYWNNIQIYEQFLERSRWNEKRMDAFDFDMTIQMYDPYTWDLFRNIKQEFITYDFIRNYNFIGYDKQEELANFPRTYFIHRSQRADN